MATDPSYGAKVYMKQGADTLVVASGGKIQIATGGQIVPDSGTIAAAITAPAATGSTSTTPFGFTTSTQADALVTAVRAIIVALQAAGITL